MCRPMSCNPRWPDPMATEDWWGDWRADSVHRADLVEALDERAAETADDDPEFAAVCLLAAEVLEAFGVSEARRKLAEIMARANR